MFMATPAVRLRIILIITGVLTLLNLILSASLIGFLAGIVILIMVWGIFRGDYPLCGILGIFLMIYGVINLIVLIAVLLFGTTSSVSGMISLGCYSATMILCGLILRSRSLLEYLKTAPQPEKKSSRFHFFHGGWRDL